MDRRTFLTAASATVMALSAKASAEEKDDFLPDDEYQPPAGSVIRERFISMATHRPYIRA
jgi:hypothetical protein